MASPSSLPSTSAMPPPPHAPAECSGAPSMPSAAGANNAAVGLVAHADAPGAPLVAAAPGVAPPALACGPSSPNSKDSKVPWASSSSRDA
eukprot:100344-Chlamydomonas_euryale.AAC.4